MKLTTPDDEVKKLSNNSNYRVKTQKTRKTNEKHSKNTRVRFVRLFSGVPRVFRPHDNKLLASATANMLRSLLKAVASSTRIFTLPRIMRCYFSFRLTRH